MDRERFKTIVAAYGASPERWPTREREQAERLARTDAQAQAALAEAQSLDSVLASAAEEVNTDLSVARAMRRFREQGGGERGAQVRALTSPLARPAWALAACALVGLALGFGAGAAAPSEADQVLTTAFQAPLLDSASEETGG
jgi:hypothetical protein